eukprot:1591773-Rhodomonas_salina.1
MHGRTGVGNTCPYAGWVLGWVLTPLVLGEVRYLPTTPSTNDLVLTQRMPGGVLLLWGLGFFVGRYYLLPTCYDLRGTAFRVADSVVYYAVLRVCTARCVLRGVLCGEVGCVLCGTGRCYCEVLTACTAWYSVFVLRGTDGLYHRLCLRCCCNNCGGRVPTAQYSKVGGRLVLGNSLGRRVDVYWEKRVDVDWRVLGKRREEGRLVRRKEERRKPL